MRVVGSEGTGAPAQSLRRGAGFKLNFFEKYPF